MHSGASRNSYSLKKYLSSIGIDVTGLDEQPLQPTFPLLSKLIKHHMAAYKYDNTMLCKKGRVKKENASEIPSLDIDTVFEQMASSKSGYCFQHIELFHAALKDLGFKVDRLLGKAIFAVTGTVDPAKIGDHKKVHAFLAVHIEDKTYIVEVGMGHYTITEPLQLTTDEQCIHNEYYRLSEKDNLWTLESRRSTDKTWFSMHQFYNKPLTADEIKEAHDKLYLSEKPNLIRDAMLLFGKIKTNPQGDEVKRVRAYWFDAKKTGAYVKSTNDGFSSEVSQSFNDKQAFEACVQKKFGR